MIKVRTILVIMLLSAVVAMGVGCSRDEAPGKLAGVEKQDQPATMEKQSQAAGAAEQGQPATESAQMSKAVELTGEVAQSADGVVIVTDMGKYAVVGQDLSNMVGKTVKVTGTVEESAGQYTINVMTVEEGE